jgi:hypothetical protein
VNFSYGLSGTAAGNYVVTQPTGLTARITPKALTITGQTGSSKVYDATTTASMAGGSLSGVIGADDVALTQAGTFASANVGASYVKSGKLKVLAAPSAQSSPLLPGVPTIGEALPGYEFKTMYGLLAPALDVMELGASSLKS